MLRSILSSQRWQSCHREPPSLMNDTHALSEPPSPSGLMNLIIQNPTVEPQRQSPSGLQRNRKKQHATTPAQMTTVHQQQEELHTTSKYPKHLYRASNQRKQSLLKQTSHLPSPPLNSPRSSHDSDAPQKTISIIFLPPSGETTKEQRSIRLSHGEPWRITKKEMEYPPTKHIAKAPIGNLFFPRSKKRLGAPFSSSLSCIFCQISPQSNK